MFGTPCLCVQTGGPTNRLRHRGWTGQSDPGPVAKQGLLQGLNYGRAKTPPGELGGRDLSRSALFPLVAKWIEWGLILPKSNA